MKVAAAKKGSALKRATLVGSLGPVRSIKVVQLRRTTPWRGPLCRAARVIGVCTSDISSEQVRLLEAPLPYRLQDALKQVSLVWAAVPERQREWPRFWVRDSNASKNLDQGAAEVVKNEELRSLDQGATEAIVTGKGALLKNLD
eukprot:scaffold80662_cov18-Tisochrysis_lutea.AAC.1